MEPDDVTAVYGGEYALAYDSIWAENGRWAAEADHYRRTIAGLLRQGDRWLDVGCGTGWNLSRFRGVERTGLDMSPDMLALARRANPDATFVQGDFLDDEPEWHDAWDLVTSCGQPWSYLPTLAHMELVAANLARWTAPTGRCFLAVGDLADLNGVPVEYPAPGEDLPDDTPAISAVIWSVRENGRLHRNMIWPTLGFWVDEFAKHFRRVEVIRWPHDPAFLPIARRNIVASDKRMEGDTEPVVVVEHPVPPSGPYELP